MKKIIALTFLVVCIFAVNLSANAQGESLFVVGSSTLGGDGSVNFTVSFNAMNYNTSVANDPAARSVLLIYDADNKLCYMDADKANDGIITHTVNLKTFSPDSLYKFRMSVDGSINEVGEQELLVYENVTSFTVGGTKGGIVNAACTVGSANNAPTVLVVVYENADGNPGELLGIQISDEVIDNTIKAEIDTKAFGENIIVKGFVFENLTNMRPIKPSKTLN